MKEKRQFEKYQDFLNKRKLKQIRDNTNILKIENKTEPSIRNVNKQPKNVIQSYIAEVKKQNAQLEVSIENGLNLNNLEQEAKEQLGMQKLNPRQTKYITLPKNDYIEPAAEQVIIEEKNTGISGIINKILNIFK